MSFRLELLPLIGLIWLAGCGRAGSADSSVLAQVDEAATAAASTTQSTRPESTLLGNWLLRSAPAQRMPGTQLTVSVDSVDGSAYVGRLSHYFAGNMGIDPAEFQACDDSISADSIVTFRLPTVDPELLGILLVGRLTNDSIALTTFVLGPDTLSKGSRRWYLVRER